MVNQAQVACDNPGLVAVASILKERWEKKVRRVRSLSPYSHLPNWSILLKEDFLKPFICRSFCFLNHLFRAAAGHYQMGRGLETRAFVLSNTGNFQNGVGYGERSRLAQTVS